MLTQNGSAVFTLSAGQPAGQCCSHDLPGKGYRWSTTTLTCYFYRTLSSTTWKRKIKKGKVGWGGERQFHIDCYISTEAIRQTTCLGQDNAHQRWEDKLQSTSNRNESQNCLSISGIQSSWNTMQTQTKGQTGKGARTWIGCRWRSCAGRSGWSKNWKKKSGCGSGTTQSPCRMKSEMLTWKTQINCITVIQWDCIFITVLLFYR